MLLLEFRLEGEVVLTAVLSGEINFSDCRSISGLSWHILKTLENFELGT